MITIEDLRSGDALSLARLQCSCGRARLFVYDALDDQVLSCLTCGQIAARSELIAAANPVLNPAHVTWLNASERSDLAMIETDIPVRATFNPGRTQPGEHSGRIVRISPSHAMLALDAGLPSARDLNNPAPEPIQIALFGSQEPLVGQFLCTLENLQPLQGGRGPICHRISFESSSPERRSVLQHFFQSACGLKFDWRVLLFAEGEQELRLRRQIAQSLPMVRIESVCRVAAFTRLYRELRPDLTIVPALPELMQMVHQREGTSINRPSYLIALVKELSCAAISHALRWGARDVLANEAGPDEVRDAVQRCQIASMHPAGSAPQPQPAAARPTPNLFLGSQGSSQFSVTEEDAIRMLCMASETHDAHSSNHLMRIAYYTAIVAARLGWDAHRTAMVATASRLHDIGKLGVPDAILRKPGKLTQDERSVMEQHTRFGHQILQSSASDVLRTGATIALRHHERWDGQGYPDGVAGDQIPLEAQVVSVADVFDALTTARAYKPAWSIEDTINYIRENNGRMFAPAVGTAFLNSIGEIVKVQTRFVDEAQDIWNERRTCRRHPVAPIEVELQIAMPEQTFRPMNFRGELCNVGLGGIKIVLKGVTNDLYAILVESRRYAKLSCGHPDWRDGLEAFCQVVWSDFYGIPDPNACLMGLGFQKVPVALEYQIDRISGNSTEYALAARVPAVV